MYIAQLVMQPLVAFFLVKFRIGKFVGITVLTWGAILCGMAGATNFQGLMATRFLLGAFESAVGELDGSCHYTVTLNADVLSPCFHCRSADVVQAL